MDIGNRIAGKAQEGTGFILLDLNGLKHVNDTLGHDDRRRYITCVSKAYLEYADQRMGLMYRIGGRRVRGGDAGCRTEERIQGFAEHGSEDDV
ncbi:MAG: hypothetical protein ACLSAC_04390 [Enterocloster bolteae]